MNILFDSTIIGWAALALVGIIIAIIYLLRYKFSTVITSKEVSSKISNRNKYSVVDVFKWSNTFLRVGMVISLAFVILAFNFTTYEANDNQFVCDLAIDEDFEIEPPRTQDPPKLPPPPPPPPVQIEIPEEPIEDTTTFIDQSLDVEDEIISEPIAEAKVETAPKPILPPPDPFKEEEIIIIAEQMPRFPGCEMLNGDKKVKDQCATKALLKFLSKNLNYPTFASENGIYGTVVISFLVERNGNLTDIKIVKDPGGGLGKEALRVVNLMNGMKEKWTPGKQNARPVRVRFNLPVKFRLQ